MVAFTPQLAATVLAAISISNAAVVPQVHLSNATPERRDVPVAPLPAKVLAQMASTTSSDAPTDTNSKKEEKVSSESTTKKGKSKSSKSKSKSKKGGKSKKNGKKHDSRDLMNAHAEVNLTVSNKVAEQRLTPELRTDRP